jgi:hypothetical protein
MTTDIPAMMTGFAKTIGSVIARRNDEAIQEQATTRIASGCALAGDGDFRDSRVFGKCIIYF